MGVSPRSKIHFSTARKTQAPYSRPLRQISTQCTNADQQSQPSGITTSSGRTTPRFLRTSSRSEEHTSELQSLMRNSYAVFCLKKKITKKPNNTAQQQAHTHAHPIHDQNTHI